MYELQRLSRIMTGLNEQLVAGRITTDSEVLQGVIGTWAETFRAGQKVVAFAPAIIGVQPNLERPSVRKAQIDRLGGMCVRVEGALINTSVAVVGVLGYGKPDVPRHIQVLLGNELVDRSYEGPLLAAMMLTDDASNVIVPFAAPSRKHRQNGAPRFIPTRFEPVSQ
jgi:hypothetical protein